ncbi:MAG: glycosyltransferase family 9 protein [Acidimicrobiales bacterium]
MPALRALASAFPDHHRVLAAPAWLAPLVRHSATVHKVVDVAPLAPLPASLHHADVAVNLHGRGPQSSRLLADSGPRRLIAFAHPDVAETGGQPRWRPDEHEVRRWCRLLRESGVPADPGDLHLEPPPVTPPPAAVGATLVHPGAAAAARWWPPERWAAVAAAEQAAGRPVVVTGGPGEAERAAEVASRARLPPAANLAGHTDLLELLAAVAVAERVVCADTGVAHMASAVGTPSVVLFGPASPAEWGPPKDGPHIALWAGYRGDPSAATVDPGLEAISTDDVLAAMARLPPRYQVGGAATG